MRWYLSLNCRKTLQWVELDLKAVWGLTGMCIFPLELAIFLTTHKLLVSKT